MLNIWWSKGQSEVINVGYVKGRRVRPFVVSIDGNRALMMALLSGTA
ncbi:hypothetical protein MHH52_28605 [Paenibacillus sp. FSL K6-0276]